MSLPRVSLSHLLIAALLACPTLAVAATAEEWDAYRDALTRGERQAAYWQYGWTGVYATSLELSAHQASEADNQDDRFDGRVGAVKSVLALGGMFLDRQPHPAARRELAQLSRETGDDDLARARTLIRATAQEERARRAWHTRLGSLAVNSVAGLVIGVGDNRPRDGAINFATGMLVNELQVWTQPYQATRALNRFQPARLSLGENHLYYQYAWRLTPHRQGMRLGMAIRY